MAPVTAFFSGILALMFILLSLLVVSQRRKVKASLGHGDDMELQRRIRAQGNFAEYVPLALILLVLAESGGVVKWLIVLLSLALLIGRLLHAYSILVDEVRDSMHIGLRKLGMVLTLGVLAIAASLCLITVSQIP